MVRKVWYKLDDNRASKVEVEDGADVDDLAKAIKKECPNALQGVDAADLQVYAAGADPTTAVPLESYDKVPSDTTGPNPLIVVALEQQVNDEEKPPFKTPAAMPRRGPNAQSIESPGARPDKAWSDGTARHLLSAAKRFCDDNFTRPIDVPAVGSLCRPSEELNRFAKVDLPHTRGQIDMRFSFPPSWPTTPVGEQLCRVLEREEPPTVVLVGKSGCGKTSAIFDAARKRFCILFTATWRVAADYTWHDPGGVDDSFSALVTDVNEIINSEDKTDEQKRIQSNHCILALVVARMLLLWTFQRSTQFRAGDGPLSWLMYQMTSDMHFRASLLYSSLKKRSRSLLEGLWLEIGAQPDMNFFFALDEAQLGYDLLKDKHLWKSQTNPQEYRGIACPLLRMLSGFKPLVVAGKAMSLVSYEEVRSGVARPKQTETIDNFPSVSIAEITARLNAVLNMEGVEPTQSALYKLEGRGRLLGGFFIQLARSIKELPSASKQDIFDDAIERHYKESLDLLAGRIRAAFGLDDNDQDKLLEGQGRKRQLPESLDIVATASLIGTPVSIARKKIKVDLLHVGLCSVRRVDEEEFVLDEELGRAAVLQVAQDTQFITDAFAKMTELCRQSAGHGMEPLIIAELHAWSARHPQKTVRDFLSEVCGGKLPDNLPGWIVQAPFSVNGGCTNKGLKSEGIKDDVQFIEEAHQKVNLRDMLLSLSTVKRPDFEAVMGKGETPWFLSVSSKLYSKPFNDKSDDDFRSTKPSKFYTKTDGTMNQNCCKLRARWEKQLEELPDLFSRCLRIHVCLPEVERPSNDNKRLFVDDEDQSIVLYVTSQNIHRIFRKECLGVLEKIGCLQE